MNSGRPTLQPDQVFFNVAEAAEFLRVSEKTVRREVENRSITHIRFGDRVLFERLDLIEFMRALKVPVPKVTAQRAQRKVIARRVK
jgi:excisionase family DNA binding protein